VQITLPEGTRLREGSSLHGRMTSATPKPVIDACDRLSETQPTQLPTSEPAANHPAQNEHHLSSEIEGVLGAQFGFLR
jgi:hypothetical protein